ncbi:MAG: tetratricopeptide repeat protein [Deltaproteobacteria bacterium]|nr:tetratricopeptide repeat protein [Deltaproteobacteria bacterium]
MPNKLKNIILFGAFVLLSSGCASTSEKMPEKLDTTTKGLSLMDVSPPAESKEVMREAVMLFNDAMSKMRFVPEKALFDFEAATKKVPGFNAAHFNLALAYLQINETKKARKSLYTTIRAGVKSSEVYTALGQTYMLEKKKKKAMRAFNYANTIKKQASTIINLANLHQLDGKFKQAKELYEKAEKIEPDNAMIDYNFGLLLLNHGEVEEATKKLKKALKLKDEYPQVISAYAKALLFSGKADIALKFYEEIIENNPALAAPYKDMGIIYEMYKRDYAKAMTHYKIYLALRRAGASPTWDSEDDETSYKEDEVNVWYEVVKQRVAKRKRR